MKRSHNLEIMSLRVGIFVAISMTFIFLVLFFPIRGVNPFSPKVHFYGYFDDVKGLKRNAPVFLSGMEVGSVQSVDFPESDKDTDRRLLVCVHVEKKILPFLHENTAMRLVSKGLLGDQFVELAPGPMDAPALKDGAVLSTGIEHGTKQEIDEVLKRVNRLLAMAENKNSNVGKLLHDGRLYEELVSTLAEMKGMVRRVSDLEDNINKKILDPATKQKIDQALASVTHVTEKMNSYTEKINRLHFLMNFGASRYTVGNNFGAIANMQIVPNPDRFYLGGIEYFNNTGPSTANDNISIDAALGFRVSQSPLFFWGGLKRTQVAGGLDLRLFNEDLSFSTDAYHYERSKPQVDVGMKYRFLNFFSLTAGVDNSLDSTPFYHGGLSFTYDDQDLSTILIKAKSGL